MNMISVASMCRLCVVGLWAGFQSSEVSMNWLAILEGCMAVGGGYAFRDRLEDRCG